VTRGAIDCDLHPAVPGVATLLPFMDEYWRETFLARGIDALESASYPPHAPTTVRADWRGPKGEAPSSLAELQAQVLDRWDTAIGILNPLFPVQLPFSRDMSAVLARAVNDWIRAEWLDKDARLRASILLPNAVEDAVAEIERLAPDRRFVQGMVLCMGEIPLGRREWWPVYAALEKHGLPLAIHAGSAWRHPPTSVGWPSWYVEEYAANAYGFQSSLASLITEGVFGKFPALKVVLIESGVTWLPGFLWRLTKAWKGVRFEIPWVDRPPAEIVRDQVRLTIRPLDAPEDGETMARILDHLPDEAMLLWATDWPHAHFEGDATIPPGLPPSLLPKIMVENPRATYSRLREGGTP
jgi:predicted TIM-barrel fold metal-dependent hydrolase